MALCRVPFLAVLLAALATGAALPASLSPYPRRLGGA